MRVAQRPRARTASLPAPTGGWNARDPLAQMDKLDAVILDNIFPQTKEVVLRYGYTTHVTGVGASTAVNSLMAYNSPTTNKLFGAAGANIYDMTNAGTVGAAVVTGQTSDKWQHVNMTTAGGSFLILVNGADNMERYDGSSWTAVSGAITNVATTSIINLNVFKRRLWMVEKNSLKIWYLPVDSITGAAAALDFSGIFKLGGYLMSMGTWSLDAGDGLDDYAAFVTSQGEVAVYKGTDPSSATTWTLQGVFVIGSPIGRRCLVKYGGDMLMISKDGLLPMSKALMSSRVNTRVALTDKIQQAASEATTTYGANFGWETMLYPAENMLLMNVPTSATTSEQYVMNTITGSWCRFTGWNATCWERFNDLIYFGTLDGVNLAWSGQSDNGANINAEALQAFNYFGNDMEKRFTLARPILSSNGTPGISIGLNVDFDLSAPVGTPTFSPTTYGIWDTGLWDAALWGGDYQIKKDWLGVNGIGRCAALHMKLALMGILLKWASTDYIYEDGGFL
jgi:hypothetical protein